MPEGSIPHRLRRKPPFSKGAIFRHLAVPEKRFGLSLFLAFFDRCGISARLLPPPAAPAGYSTDFKDSAMLIFSSLPCMRALVSRVKTMVAAKDTR